MIKYPEKINELHLGISSISDGANQKLVEVLKQLKKNNIIYTHSPFVFKSTGQVSEQKETRAKDFLEMWNSKEINYIMAAFGGEFCMELLPYIYEHKDEFLTNKKWFQGFSDASILTYFLTTNFNISTINYYNAEDYGSLRNISKLKFNLEKILCLQEGYSFSQSSSRTYVDDYSRDIDDRKLEVKKTKPLCLEEEISFKGRLIGGWIEAISTICGTKYDNTKNYCDQFKEGVIWYIDNCELSSPMLRRKLWQMEEAGYFNNCNGVLIGRQPTDDFDGDYDYHKALIDTFRERNIPFIENVDIGHFFPQWMMINGSYTEVHYKDNKVKILERLK